MCTCSVHGTRSDKRECLSGMCGVLHCIAGVARRIFYSLHVPYFVDLNNCVNLIERWELCVRVASMEGALMCAGT